MTNIIGHYQKHKELPIHSHQILPTTPINMDIRSSGEDVEKQVLSHASGEVKGCGYLLRGLDTVFLCDSCISLLANTVQLKNISIQKLIHIFLEGVVVIAKH